MKVNSIKPEQSIDDLPAGVCPFQKSDWKPAEYRQLKSEEHKRALREKGYFVVENFFDSGTITGLKDLYHSLEHVGVNELGMFVSAYSPDIEYRKTVHKKIGDLVESELNSIFESFKPILYNFVLKESRPGKTLPLHQDHAMLDEDTTSSINIWIPLMNVHPDSGTLCIVPKTQYFFPPFRSRFNELDISDVEEDLGQYRKEMHLNLGDLLVFDSRLIHGSLPNTSGKDRVAAMCHICPADAQFQMLSRSNDQPEDEFVVIEFEREDLFQAKGYESANKSEFPGTVTGKVTLGRTEIDSAQLHDYFKSVGMTRSVPVTATPTPEREKTTSNNGLMQWVRKVIGWS